MAENRKKKQTKIDNHTNFEGKKNHLSFWILWDMLFIAYRHFSNEKTFTQGKWKGCSCAWMLDKFDGLWLIWHYDNWTQCFTCCRWNTMCFDFSSAVIAIYRGHTNHGQTEFIFNKYCKCIEMHTTFFCFFFQFKSVMICSWIYNAYSREW